MSADQNKDVVRRFITEVLAGGHLDRVDELLGTNFVDRSMGTDLEATKGMLAGFVAALPARTFQIEDLVAEGDSVVARYSGEVNDPNGNAISFRGLTYYRLAEGRIVEADPITTPDVAHELGKLMSPPPA